MRLMMSCHSHHVKSCMSCLQAAHDVVGVRGGPDEEAALLQVLRDVLQHALRLARGTFS